MKKDFYFSCVKLGEKEFCWENTFFLQKTGKPCVKWSFSTAKPYFSLSYTQHVFVSYEIKIHLGSRMKKKKNSLKKEIILAKLFFSLPVIMS